MDLIHRFWNQLCEFRTEAVSLDGELVLGDLWGGDIMDSPHKQPIFLDWEGAVIAPKERDLFTYMGLEYETFRSTYASTRQLHLLLNPSLVGFYAYRQQLTNLAQWTQNLLQENYEAEQKHNDLEMLGFHCLDRWSSIESQVLRPWNQ